MTTIIGIYAIPDISDEKYPVLIHDHNLAVYSHENQVDYLHQERISRKKYDASLQNSLETILPQLNISKETHRCFVFTDHEIGRSVLSGKGKIRFEAPLNSHLANGLEKGKLFMFGKWEEAYVLNHELAHIYSCIPFYGMFKENSLLVHFDGGASKSNFSAWHYKKGQTHLLEAHYKLKWLSSLFNANALVFSIVQANIQHQNAVPGKFMGLEAFGTYQPQIEDWLRKNNFFENCWGSKKEFYQSAKETFGISMNKIDNSNQFIQDISATFHEIFIRESLLVFKRLKEESGADYLYYSGGSALNIKLNARLLSSNLFTEVYIPPCTNDAGLSIGAMTAGIIEKKQKLPKLSPYLNNVGLSSLTTPIKLESLELVARLIADNKVIGLCNGMGEVGPRALGNRSIIARADNQELAKRISTEHKKREWYRPIAPVILPRYFKHFTGQTKVPMIATFMLSEFKILPTSIADIAGCVHFDGTSRIQVLPNREFNPYLYDLLELLDEKYDIKALINTSFNIQGEPIVHTAEDARKSAINLGLDALVINGELSEIVNKT